MQIPRGSEEYNKALTQRRVERTKNFLVEHGVSGGPDARRGDRIMFYVDSHLDACSRKTWLEMLSVKLLMLLSYKRLEKGWPSFVSLCVGGAWATDMLGDSSCSGSRPILSSQLSLGMEYAVTSTCIGDPDCRASDLKRANDLKKVSLASQENSSQDCPKANSYLF
jgi:hypothetical protein